MAGRPTKLTPATTAKVCQAVKLGLTYKLSAQYAGISTGTFMRWMQLGREQSRGRYREFFDAVKSAEGAGAVQNMARISKAATEGTWQASAWIMERRHGYTTTRGEESANRSDAMDEEELQDDVLDRAALIEELRALPPDLLRAALIAGSEDD